MDAATGNARAFEALIARHYDRIHALAWKFTGGPPDSEDLAQDVCIALGRKIRSFRGEARFTTWLYQVVLNAARDGMRRDKTRAAATANFAEVDDLRRGADADRAQQAEWVRLQILDLKSDLRETAVLVLDEGLSHGEAAEIMGVAESTISWRLMEVRKALRTSMETESRSIA